MQVGARQEDHADGKAVGQRIMAARRDRVVKEADGQVDMDAGAVAGLAIRVDGTAMPDGLQRVDRRRHNAARGFAIGGGDEADAAGIGFEFGAIHALAGETFAFGFDVELLGHGRFASFQNSGGRGIRANPYAGSRAFCGAALAFAFR